MKKFTLFFTLFISTSLTQAQELSGLIAKYSFNSITTTDDFGSNDLSTISVGVLFTADRFGNENQAVNFNGVSGYLRTTNPFFTPGSPFSISLWFKSADANQSTQTFFNTDPHAQLSVGYNWFGNNTYDIALNDGTAWNICSNAANGLDTFSVNTVNATDWNHFTMTYDGTTWLSYMNSTVVNTCNVGTPTSVLSDLYFGAISSGPQSFFKGDMDDIRIFNRALTAQEVNQLNNEIDPSTIGLTELTVSTIQIAPNPATNEITVSSNQENKITITSILGEVINQFELNSSYTIDLTSYAPGVYYLTTNTGEAHRFTKE